MAKFTKEVLKIVKQKFENREFIIVNNRIYKRVKFSSRITFNIENKELHVLVRYLVIGYNKLSSYRNSSEVYKKVSKQFEQLVKDGIYVIDSNELFKKYGAIHQRGYIQFSIIINGISYNSYAHRIIFYLHYGYLDDDLVINHKDSKKDNNDIDNLELITQFENILYSISNHEIIFSPDELDDYVRNKYHIYEDEKWEIFKKVAIDAYNNGGKEKKTKGKPW